MSGADEIIKLFNMKPLTTEGGYYVETYRAKEKLDETVLPKRYKGKRNFSTAILFLITKDSFSKLHRLKSDEIFHFYLGDPVQMLLLHSNGKSEIVTLGRDISAGQKVQIVVPRNCWQGCILKDGGKFTLMGCTVSPGFEPQDYEQGVREELIKKYPTQKKLIIKLTNKQKDI